MCLCVCVVVRVSDMYLCFVSHGVSDGLREKDSVDVTVIGLYDNTAII